MKPFPYNHPLYFSSVFANFVDVNNHELIMSTQNHIGIIKICVLWFAAAVAFMSCSDKIEQGGNTQTDDNVMEVKVSPDRTGLYRNPFSGWMIYYGLGSDSSVENFWKRYDNFPSSAGMVNVPKDYAPILLMRVIWSEINPEEGVYLWQKDCNTEAAKRFKELVAGAKKRNMRLAFNFCANSQDKHYNICPEYLRTKGCKYFETQTGSVTVWTPYPDDPVFQECYAQLIHDFAQEFDDPDITAFAGGFGVGKWGEYHNCIYSTGDETPREQVFNFLVDTFVKEFKKIPITINAHRWIGTCKEDWSGGKFDPESERLVQSAIAKGFSLQSAAFGMKTYFSTWEKAMLLKNRYNVPIASEGGWVKASHGDSYKGDGYSDWADVRKGEFLDAQGSCVNVMDLRYNQTLEVSEAWSWFNEAYDYVLKFIEEGCYRLYPDRLSLPKSFKAGETVTIKHRWINLGWSYCPTNIRQWEGKYKTAFALLDKETLQPVAIQFDEKARPCDWLKGQPTNYVFRTAFDGVEPGEYVWAVGISDTWKENKPGIFIATKKNVTKEGWVKLGNVTVED